MNTLTRPVPKSPAAFIPPRTLYVKQFDWPLRWQVESETDRAHPHMVDLGSYNSNGECSCLHFACRMAPELKQGRHPSNATRCKHIAAARGMLCDVMVKNYISTKQHTGKLG